jgi:hypothetical protein
VSSETEVGAIPARVKWAECTNRVLAESNIQKESIQTGTLFLFLQLAILGWLRHDCDALF